MKPSIEMIIATVLLTIMLGGCTAREYSMDPSMGIAVHQNLEAQIVNPNGVPPTGPQGLAGAPAKAVMDRYDNSFTTPPPPVNAFAIGIGAGGSPSMATPAASGATP